MQNISAFASDLLKANPTLDIRENELMKNHTSFKIGGSVTAMAFPKSQAELNILCTAAKNAGIKPLIIGNGTNLLVSDKPLDIFVIKMFDGLSNVTLTGDNTISAESGILLSKLAVFALNHGLSGLEFAHGIPGTVGGAVSMNAGAYGGEIKDVVTEVSAISADMNLCKYKGDENDFSYRHSRFSDTEDIIVSAEFKLTPGDPVEIKAKMDELSAKRRASQPLTLPSAGSTFKRPANGYAAAMIEQAGLKGFTVGGAQVSEKHSGFVVNCGDASFDDVIRVMEHVQKTVYEKFDTMLAPEVKIIR